MRRTTEQMIETTINEGFKLLSSGIGNYEESFMNYRKEGYVVRAWYVGLEEGNRKYVIYGKKKSQRVSKPVVIDYEAMTVKELKKLCSERKIARYSKMSKSEMVESLKVSESANKAC